MNFKKCLVIAALCILSGNAASQTVPNIFSPNTPAKAAEVNENFDFLASKSMGMNLIDGEIEIDVDCTSDAAALNKSYTEHVNYKDLNFNIKGNCYGDITVKRSFNGQGAWEGNFYQVVGQSISISPQEGQTAGLIPNDLSGKVTIWGGFGGALHLHDLTITLGEGWDFGAAYSRNSHGSVVGVSIIGPNVPDGTGIWVQAGAQVYIQGVNISKVTWGVYGSNNASIRFLGGASTISSQYEGIKVLGSSVHQQTELNVTSSAGTALDLDGGTNWMGWGKSITASGNNVWVGGGSTLAVGTLAVTGVVDVENTSVVKADNFSSTSHLQVTGSEVNLGTVIIGGNITLNMSKFIAQSLTTVGFNSLTSSASIYSGDITATALITQQSFINASNVTFDYILLEQSSTLKGNTITARNLQSQDNSFFDLLTATITEELSLDSNSTGVLQDVTFNGTTFGINQSLARIMGTTKMPTSKLTCYGLSQLEYEGISNILQAVPDSNCLDRSSITTLMDLVKSNHVIPE